MSKPSKPSKPESIKIQPWTDFSKQNYAIFKDDFANEKLWTTKIAASGGRSTFNLKETVERKDSGLLCHDEVKLWFDLPNQTSLYGKVSSKDYLKIHYDNGVKEFRGRNWNFYGSIVCNKSLKNASVRVGGCHVSEKCNSDNRLKWSLQDSLSTYHWYHRTMINHNKFTFGFLGVVNITSNLLQKNNILVGYKHNPKNELFLRLQVDGFRKNAFNPADPKAYFDFVTADYISKINDDVRVGVQASFNLKELKLRGWQLLGQKKILQSKGLVKGKITNNLDVSLSLKRPVPSFEDIATLTATGVVTEIQKNTRNFSYGFQLDLNL